ncbi:hypothetical protein [Chitinimonas lacunae]|uniref:Uncharacterized protein n=1 Tax=Chitinimonas lacunae TaxID=1963018 RepID=A0ABV8MWL9_9NEIS
MKRPLVLGSALGATIAALAWWSHTAPAPTASGAVPPKPATVDAKSNGVEWAIPQTEPAEAPVRDSPLLPIDQSRSASDSLAAAGFDGDERAPRVVRSQPWRETPTPWELSDPKAYQQYEIRQNQRLAASYLKATDSALPVLQSDIERGRQQGIDPREIAQAEEKMRRIAAIREELQGKYPELARSAANASAEPANRPGKQP